MEILAPACYLANGKIAQTTIAKLKLMLLGLFQKGHTSSIELSEWEFSTGKLVFNLPGVRAQPPGLWAGNLAPTTGCVASVMSKDIYIDLLDSPLGMRERWRFHILNEILP